MIERKINNEANIPLLTQNVNKTHFRRYMLPLLLAPIVLLYLGVKKNSSLGEVKVGPTSTEPEPENPFMLPAFWQQLADKSIEHVVEEVSLEDRLGAADDPKAKALPKEQLDLISKFEFNPFEGKADPTEYSETDEEALRPVDADPNDWWVQPWEIDEPPEADPFNVFGSDTGKPEPAEKDYKDIAMANYIFATEAECLEYSKGFMKGTVAEPPCACNPTTHIKKIWNEAASRGRVTKWKKTLSAMKKKTANVFTRILERTWTDPHTCDNECRKIKSFKDCQANKACIAIWKSGSLHPQCMLRRECYVDSEKQNDPQNKECHKQCPYSEMRKVCNVYPDGIATLFSENIKIPENTREEENVKQMKFDIKKRFCEASGGDGVIQQDCGKKLDALVWEMTTWYMTTQQKQCKMKGWKFIKEPAQRRCAPNFNPCFGTRGLCFSAGNTAKETAENVWSNCGMHWMNFIKTITEVSELNSVFDVGSAAAENADKVKEAAKSTAETLAGVGQSTVESYFKPVVGEHGEVKGVKQEHTTTKSMRQILTPQMLDKDDETFDGLRYWLIALFDTLEDNGYSAEDQKFMLLYLENVLKAEIQKAFRRTRNWAVASLTFGFAGTATTAFTAGLSAVVTVPVGFIMGMVKERHKTYVCPALISKGDGQNSDAFKAAARQHVQAFLPKKKPDGK